MKCFLLTAIFLFFIPGFSSALERFELITTAEMEKLLDERDSGKVDFLLVNSLDKMIYRAKSLPGSINIPLGAFSKCKKKLGMDKNKPIITYCMGYR